MPAKQTILLKSCNQSIVDLEKFVNVVATEYNIESDKYPDILISLTEAVNNAIIHGNKSDESKYVKVVLRQTTKGISFCVSDEGTGFNPSQVPDPTEPSNLDCCGGRGVFLIKQLADEVSYHDNGTRVTISFSV